MTDRKPGVAEEELSEQEKVIALFKFLRELNKLKQKSTLNYKDYPWAYPLSKLPDNPEHVRFFWRDRVEEESGESDTDEGTLLLSVHKPEFETCPEPAVSFSEWLLPDWDSYQTEAGTYESFPGENGEEPLLFTADSERVADYEAWLAKRSLWVERQRLTETTRDLFSTLYRMYFDLQRDSETQELIVANGVISDRENPAIRHPVLTRRVKLEYDPDGNTVSILDTEAPSELYSVAFQVMENVNLGGIKTLTEDLQANDYHPLDRNDTPGFLKVLVHQLSPDGRYSENGTPTGWTLGSRLLLCWEPCYILRKRLDGTLKAIEQIIENVQETGEIPSPIRDIVSGGTIDIPEESGESSIEEQLAAVGGESTDILLSKEANKEQLEIARRIEKYNAVLVQGPPGTGKTHTIANLMGHFLAQGKSVLVTSHTTKALSVLKEKVAEGLQSLCVSILDDSNVDMERSIDGITGYMSKTTSHELKREMELLAVERQDIIEKLADVRRKIFAIIARECGRIVYEGEELSPSAAARFVAENAETLSYIPGTVHPDSPLPLSFEELTRLYRSNEGITPEDERELETGLPAPGEIPAPSELSEIFNSLRTAREKLESAASANRIRVEESLQGRRLSLWGDFGNIDLDYPEESAVQELKGFVSSFGKIEGWMKAVAVDGKKGTAYRQRWLTLIEQIEKTIRRSDTVVGELFGVELHFAESENRQSLKGSFEALRAAYAEKGKISKLTLMMHKDYAQALGAVTINDHHPQSEKDCELVLHALELDAERKQCAVYWNELLSAQGAPKFQELDTAQQERVAGNWIPYIRKYLDWYQDAYLPLIKKMRAVGLSEDTVFATNILDSELTATDKMLSAVSTLIPALCEILLSALREEQLSGQLHRVKTVLLSGKRGSSRLCDALNDALDAQDVNAYADAYAALDRMYEKYTLRSERAEKLSILESVAPQWAEAIRSRSGIHGSTSVPADIEDAWKWKQLSGIVEEITAKPFAELQSESLRLGKEYRSVTAEYAEKSGWYHLLRRTEADIDMKQALQGWKQTVKRIGKGTGKLAPALKAKARSLMTRCQNAVPGWIMPMNRALESLDPKRNRFDIIIIDEASQSDVSALAILYMGRKLVIVGDDKQVSPLAVGVEVEKMSSLEQMYIRDKIPNSHLYNAKTSIYDIAATTFQPLMLREHFRCVPDIIGFSNMLSYDYKIKPLRDAGSSVLTPAVVNYRVEGGFREGKSKINAREAKTVVALLRACMEQPEYADKSFGVISLLGDEQVKFLQMLIETQIDAKEIVRRDILCGNSANFQGDERDVVFLSMVDSGDGTGAPLTLRGFGSDDANRKRYNVAASRAKDQLWVVHSLDSAAELKSGDIRKTLIDYAANPHAAAWTDAKSEELAESTFEAAVAEALTARGYHLEQQRRIGAYRLDMVALCGAKSVAIECDGESFHSGEARIREDMERQTILERLGWRFIRIRGSEFYRDAEKTLGKVCAQLRSYGIEPEATETAEASGTELFDRVRARAEVLLRLEDEKEQEAMENTVVLPLPEIS